MSRRIVSGVTIATVGAALAFAPGCLTRPVAEGNPVTKTSFTNSINETSIDKLDILFDIDNSASMGDKQVYLAEAIPDLINRLVTPNCVDMNGIQVGVDKVDSMGACPNQATGETPEFPPVHDMHIGIVSSSLGPRGDDPKVCNPTAMQTTASGSLPRHNDDRAELLNRTTTPANLNSGESASLATTSSNFLYWYPAVQANTGKPTVPSGATVETNAGALATDFTNLVYGVHQFGCGIESQLESWYRFLVQPDPYASIQISGNGAPPNTNGTASWVGVDKTIIQQRHDFLRPDSLVAVIVLSDENDSEIDVRSLGGLGHDFMDISWQPPRGTAICATNPLDPGCKSCSAGGVSGDPACMMGSYPNTPPNWGFDLNLRHVHMPQKYGVDPQFPIQRYLIGLTSPKVPDRNGAYPSGANSYQGLNASNQDCLNPLFAASLPDGSQTDAATLCNAMGAHGPRSANLIYYAHIGGVPHQLLQQNPMDPNSPQKDTIAAADWVKILGNDPLKYDYSGIDPHMIESYLPRPGLSPTGSAEGTDPINGREWLTDGTNPTHVNLDVDREYACTFPLEDANGNPTPRQCDPNGPAALADPTLSAACDCGTTGIDHDHLPAVCNDKNVTQQDSAKAYPTIRELLLAKLMGGQGIVSSLCPIHLTDNSSRNDPLWGYRPAITAIVNRLKAALQHQCLPQKLIPDKTTGAVSCVVLATLPSGSQADCSNTTMYPSLGTVDPTVLQHFQADQHAQFQNGQATTDLSLQPTCEVNQVLPSQQINGNCNTSAQNTPANPPGWCYVENAKGCAQALYFSPGSYPAGSTISLQCLESTSSFATGNGSSSTPAGDAGH